VWWRAGSIRAGVGAGLGLWLGLPDVQRMNVDVFEGPTGNGHVFGTLLIDL